MKIVPNEILNQVIDDYTNNNLSIINICLKYKVSREVLIRNLERLNFKFKSGPRKKYHCNEHYFDIIDDEHKAYWLGLLYADGCNQSNRPRISIKLQERDKEILEKFRDDLQSNIKLKLIDYKKYNKNNQNQILLVIDSKHMADSLKRLGCIPKKSLTLKFPTFEQVPEHLLKHFIRGYFDGDGCLSWSFSRTKKIEASFSFISTNDFFVGVKTFINKELGIDIKYKNKAGNYNQNNGKTGNVSVIKIMNWLYDGATIYLERKYQKYIEIINIYYNQIGMKEGRGSFPPLPDSLLHIKKEQFL
jgi:hypothetical protein